MNLRHALQVVTKRAEKASCFFKSRVCLGRHRISYTPRAAVMIKPQGCEGFSSPDATGLMVVMIGSVNLTAQESQRNVTGRAGPPFAFISVHERLSFLDR